MRMRPSVHGWFVLSLVMTVPAVGQPGVPGASSLSRDRYLAELYEKIQQGVDETLRDWHAAWASGDTRAVAALYTEDALLALPGGDPMRGRERMEQRLALDIAALGRVRVSQFDFAASGRMAFVMGPFSYTVTRQGLSWLEGGTHVTVFVRGRRPKFRILSQAFVVDAPLGQRPRATRDGAGAAEAAPDPAQELALRMSPVGETLVAWRRAWMEGDAQRLAGLYTEEAILLMPGGPPLRGRPRIQPHFAQALRTLGPVHMGHTDLRQSGRMVFVAGPFSYRVEDGEASSRAVSGVHLTVWRRDGDQWQIRLQVFRAD